MQRVDLGSVIHYLRYMLCSDQLQAGRYLSCSSTGWWGKMSRCKPLPCESWIKTTTKASGNNFCLFSTELQTDIVWITNNIVTQPLTDTNSVMSGVLVICTLLPWSYYDHDWKPTTRSRRNNSLLTMLTYWHQICWSTGPQGRASRWKNLPFPGWVQTCLSLMTNGKDSTSVYWSNMDIVILCIVRWGVVSGYKYSRWLAKRLFTTHENSANINGMA